MGLLITWHKDIRNNKEWYGRVYHDSDLIVVRVTEPPVEKEKSFKVNGSVEAIIHNRLTVPCKGRIFLYFSKELSGKPVDSTTDLLLPGDILLINKNLQPIKNSGNPGAFDYEQYAAFQQIFHSVFLKEKDWVKTGHKNSDRFKQFLFATRDSILSILRKHISGSKYELGIAEALLIGYTHDLDKDIVEAYSNTGVVHIIAVSGMHLGLIYVMLVWLFGRIPLLKKSKIIQVILIVTILWLFSLLTGASASVLRSAVMFTFITVGKSFLKQSSIYNSLAASAFLLLCFNPYFLWDVGFELSYLAVIGIVIFQKPIYNWIYFKNNLANEIWKMLVISLAAQVLTFPICIYYFHQFPNLFLFTNIIAVPLSGIILFSEIGLVAFSFIPFAGVYLGKLIGCMLWAMNRFILWVSQLPFAVWDNIPSTPGITLFLYGVVIWVSAWLLNKSINAFHFAILCLFGFALLHVLDDWHMKNQQKIIVYNIPQHRAIDFVSGNNFCFLGDSVLLEDGALQNFHLKPARISFQLYNRADTLDELFQRQLFFQFAGKRIILIDKPLMFEPLDQKIDIDLVIISKSPKLQIAQLAIVFNCRQFIFDASNSWWKINQWQKECKELHLNVHSTPSDGAFIFDIGL